MASEASTFGPSLRDVKRALRRLDDKSSMRLQEAGTRSFLRVIRKAVKQAIPARMKDARKGVGWRYTRKDKRTKQVFSKAGAAVGIKRAKRAALLEGLKSRDGKSGVGISVANLHWYLAGTGSRTRQSGGSTGSSQGYPQLVPTAARGALGAARKKYTETVKKGLVREAAKARAR